MGKGKGRKGKKSNDLVEPEHDPSWERTVDSGIWDRPPIALPDANIWPTWGALRERVLNSCKQIKITWSQSLRDAFPAEIVKLSPPELSTLEFKGAENLRTFVLSPMTACPKLNQLDMSLCKALDYVLLQSQSLTKLDLSSCKNLKKALIHCPKLQKLKISDCENLDTLMIWSDEITKLDLTGAVSIRVLELHCPALIDTTIPTLKAADQPIKPNHPPISHMLRDEYKLEAHKELEEKENEQKIEGESTIPKVFRPLS